MGKNIILGAGMTGLAAGWASGLPVFEAEEFPGGICSSYYVKPGSKERLHSAPDDGDAYRFEIGGGHWLFGGDPAIVRFLRSLVPMREYERKSSVFFPHEQLFVSYPIQNHLAQLGKDVAVTVLNEITHSVGGNARTMDEWLVQSFGKTLAEKFFAPFHELYTAGLWTGIAPQDGYKSPVQKDLVVKGAFDKTPPVGYNTRYLYPVEGLNTMASRLREAADVKFGKRVAAIDIRKKEVNFFDGSGTKYDSMINTLPLNKVMELTSLDVDEASDPHTSVLVLNIGATKGPRCPGDHWIYVPKSASGFHRVGFYSNVDASFLPARSRSAGDRTSIYVERSFANGVKPAAAEVEDYCRRTESELRDWGFIRDVEVNDPTWIDVAYTWMKPGSRWKNLALKKLEEHDIVMIGRYARWNFQGIADSVRDGLFSGASLKARE